MTVAGTRQRTICTFAALTAPLVPANPTSVSAKVQGPDGAVLTVTPVSTTVGVWYVDWTPTGPGIWRCEVRGTGVVAAVAVSVVRVTPSITAP